jgi:hypothetical protein
MSGKAVAEKAVKTAKGIDWGLLERLVKSEDGRKELLTLRRTIDETRAQLSLFKSKVSRPAELFLAITYCRRQSSW